MDTTAARIDSYFSLPVDLAAGMRAWPEFVSGEGYCVELGSADGQVSVCLVNADGDDCQHVLVKGKRESRLFQAVLGQVAFALAAHSDSVSISRWGAHEV